jgi:hypothetical protein
MVEESLLQKKAQEFTATHQLNLPQEGVDLLPSRKHALFLARKVNRHFGVVEK